MEMDDRNGIVGIFDALGAKNFTLPQIQQFVNNQEEILKKIDDKSEDQMASRNLAKPTIFSFNDTIIIEIGMSNGDEYNVIKGFAKIARRFISYSLTKGLLFRGAFAVGKYSVDVDKNMILGEAVSDAASWYEEPELIGAIATPRTTMLIDMHVSQDTKPPNFILFKYTTPCKSGNHELFAVNWSKAFYVQGLRPENCKNGQEYSSFLSLLSQNQVPKGVEKKYFNTIHFFRAAEDKENLTN